jgi:hypothetical protein
MTNEYGDPISPEVLDTAASTAIRLFHRDPDASLSSHVTNAVQQTVCACTLGIADEIEGHLSGVHLFILDEVTRRVVRDLQTEQMETRPDRVDVASEESFPCSDPPGWIWERAPRDGAVSGFNI